MTRITKALLCGSVLAFVPCSTEVCAQVDFDSLSVATTAYGIPGSEGRPHMMTGFQGKIYFSTYDDGTAAPSKVNVYDPADGHVDGVNHSVLLQGTERFNVLYAAPTLLYIASGDGRLYTYDGLATSEVTSTPFSPERPVWSIYNFNGTMYFGDGLGDVHRFDGASWTLVFDSPNAHVGFLISWNNSLYGVARSPLLGANAIWFWSATGNPGDWEQRTFNPGIYACDVLVPTSDYLYAGMIDSVFGYYSSVRRSPDGLNWPPIHTSGGYKIPFDGILYDGYIYVAFNIYNGNQGRMIRDDGTETSQVDTLDIVMQMVELNGHLYTAQLDTDGGIYAPGNVLIMTDAPAQGPCGDGVVDSGEACDDGNLDDGDGCSSICAVEPECVCSGEPSLCACTPLPVDAGSWNDRPKNRYISFKPNNNVGQTIKLEVTLTASIPHPTLVGNSWWVQPPMVPEPGEIPIPLLGTGECVALLGPQATAADIDWANSGCTVLHVTGCPIEPTSDYEVRAEAGTAASEPLAVSTILKPGDKHWGDTVGIFNGAEWTAPQGETNIDDVSVVIRTFQGGPIVAPDGNVAHLSVADVDPGDINLVTNINDALLVILAFKGEGYPFGPAGPDGKCPPPE